MLPKYEICRKHILAYQKRTVAPAADTVTFSVFWNYKTGLEKDGQSILDEKNIDDTVSRICSLLSYLDVKNPALTEAGRIKQVLRNIRPYYSDFRQAVLGSGKIYAYRYQIESVYERMAKKAGRGDKNAHDFSIVTKSAILMAVWGQVPRLDSIARKRFEKWIHWPAPEKLPYLTSRDIWYRPDEFREMVVALDKWVLAWPATNNGKSFESCFYDSDPAIPPGRQIDIIYHWEMPRNFTDYRLQTGGSYYDKTYIDTLNKFIVD
ncbi:MAG: hypothetical protein JXA46_14445 [Dehalococcoidales bacterium]|nr:hypothetical protein [Dehalococcoidales bacterium]